MSPKAAYTRLGLTPAATLKEIKAAHRKLAKQYHPDVNADPSASAMMKEINAAYDECVKYYNIFGATTNADSATVDEPVAPPKAGEGWFVWECSAPAGEGKTRGWTQAVAFANKAMGVRPKNDIDWPPSRPHRLIMATPTIALMNETAEALRKLGVKHVTVINHESQERRSYTVQGKLGKHLVEYYKTRPDSDEILICSHAAVMAMGNVLRLGEGEAAEMIDWQKDWDLTFDEAPEVINFVERKWPQTHTTLTRHVSVEPYGEMLRLIPKRIPNTPVVDESSLTALRSLAEGGFIPDDGLETFREVATAIKDYPRCVVLVNRDQWYDLTATNADGSRRYGQDMNGRGELIVAILTLPEVFQGFRSFSILGARLPTTMCHTLWSKLSNVRFKAHPLQAKLNAKHSVAQGKRLHVHYIFDERLMRYHLKKETTDGRQVFKAMCETIDSFFGKRPFIWTAPLHRQDSEFGVKDNFFEGKGFDAKLRLPGRSFGLNKYRHIDNAALLSVVNFSPNHFILLHKLGFTDDEIMRALQGNVVYQDALRCSLRDRNSTSAVNIVVPDLAIAKDLAHEFPSSTISKIPNAPTIAANKKSGPKPSGNAKSNADRQREFRERKRREREREADSER